MDADTLSLRGRQVVNLVCHEVPSIRSLVTAGASPFAMSRGMGELPLTTPDTVALRSGLRLGLIRSTK